MPSSKKPIYQQIQQYIYQNIGQRHWKVGDKIPSETTLASIFSTSRGTVNKALHKLTDQGILIRESSLGTRIASPIRHNKFELPVPSIENINQFHWEVIQQDTLTQETLSDHLSTSTRLSLALSLQAPEKIIHIRLKYSKDLDTEQGIQEIPVFIDDIFVNPLQYPGFEKYNWEFFFPLDYLQLRTPLAKGNYTIYIDTAPDDINDLLNMDTDCSYGIYEQLTLSSQNYFAYAILRWSPQQFFKLEGEF